MVGRRRRVAADGDEEEKESKVVTKMDEMSKKFDLRMGQLEDKLTADKKGNAEKAFVLKHTFKKVLDMSNDAELYQPSEEHFGRQWSVFIKRKDDYLSVYLGAENPDAAGAWLIRTDHELEIVVGKESIFQKQFGRISNEHTAYGSPRFVHWEEMKKRYLKNGELTVQARVKILNMTGILKQKVFHFDESNKQHSDIVLKVGNEKFYVGKDLLTHQSPYFTRMFAGDFKEGQPETKEVELPETDAQDFQNFLEVLYGDARPDDHTVEGILHLNDVYHAKNVLRECVEFLMNKSEKKLRKKLELASRYQLNALADECVSKVTPDEYKSMVKDRFTDQLSKYSANALLKKSVTFF